jgi:hypothetical protein
LRAWRIIGTQQDPESPVPDSRHRGDMTNQPTTVAPPRGRARRSLGTLARHRSDLVGLVVALAALAGIVYLAQPFGPDWSTGREAFCYWQASLADPYARSDWTNPIAYVYSPAFLQLVAPLTALPWQVFVAAWTIILLVGVRFLTGPRWFVFGIAFALMEVGGGNISILLAVAMVVGFRWPAAWAFVLLTKVTPGVGLLWFAVRREWNALATALVATGMIVAGSALLLPGAWADWLTVLGSAAGRGGTGTWAAIPVPFLVRLPIAVALVVWGARTDRRWTVPVAGMIALPALWYGGFSMLLATFALNRPEWRDAGGAGTGLRAEGYIRPLRSSATA